MITEMYTGIVNWRLDVEDRGWETYRTIDGRTEDVRVRSPSATLTLSELSMAECEAVVTLLTGMRVAPNAEITSPEPSLTERIRNRFSGLDLEGAA